LSAVNDFRLAKDVRPARYVLSFDLDLDKWTSLGNARIEVRLGRAAREITLHAIDLDISAADIDGTPMTKVTTDAESQTATVAFPREMPAGDHVLTLAWSGSITERLRGLYRSTRGTERYAATQFEAADARRAFPCFDEPEFKARFSIELVHPTGLVALGNMPLEGAEKLPDGRTRSRFVETPPISSYLVAFTVGPYEATPEARTPSGIPVRVWMPPGLAEKAVYARDAHVRAVAWLEEYTAIPYQYRKVDAIAIPDFEAGAMENPGAITYRVTLLQADKATASTTTFKAVFSVAAHELTHMWWGDLVTMAWWTDLWLNESFASFVGEKCTAALNPEWGFWRDVVAQNTSAFSLDSLLSTHPISVEAKNVEEASERFDAITYTKGQGVLRMMETFLGEKAFRDGVRIYLNRHREANATADDFWHALDESSGRDVTTVANAWIKESGHPLVTCEARETSAGIEVSLRQRRFFRDPDAPPTVQRWPIPMVFKYGTAAGTREERVLLEGESTRVTLPGARWYFPNAAGAGFYRTALDDASIRLLRPAVSSLDPEERLSLADNQWALVTARKATVGQAFDLIRGLEGETDRAVLGVLYEQFAWLSANAVQPATEGAFRAFVERLFRPTLDSVGSDPRADDSADERQKRVVALNALGRVAAAVDVRREARRRVLAHLDGGARLDPDLAAALVGIAAIEGDAALYDRYIERMKAMATADAQEEARFRNALADFEDPALVRRTADAIFTDLIRDQDRGLLLLRMHGQRHARDIAFRALTASWDEHVSKMDPGGKHRMVNAVGQLTPRDLAAEGAAFLRAKETPDIRETVAQSTERMRLNSANAERMARELSEALHHGVAEPA